VKKLTLNLLVAGRTKPLQNAADLVQDAELLLDKKRWARAVFLSQIAIEELGKYLMIIGAIGQVLKNQIHWKRFWKRFNKHTEKTGNILTFNALLSPFVSLGNTKTNLEKARRDEAYLEKRKFTALYVDFELNKFVLPMDVIDKETAEVAVREAKAVLEFFEDGEKKVPSKVDLTRLTPEKLARVAKKLKLSLWDKEA